MEAVANEELVKNVAKTKTAPKDSRQVAEVKQ